LHVSADGTCTTIQQNINFPGHDLHDGKQHADSAADCCAKCAAASGCTAFSWVSPTAPNVSNSYKNVCWLKTSNNSAMSDVGRFSGVCAAPSPSPSPSPHPPPSPSPSPCTQGSSWCPPPPPLPPPKKPVRVCTTCKKPKFSWEKLPIFFHGCNLDGNKDGGFNQADLDIIKHFPLVTMEKWQGQNVEPYTWEEDAWVAAAKQIKDINPDIAVVVWFDSFRIYTANKTLNPDLGTSCTTGHYRGGIYPETHRSMLLKNTSGLPALEPWSKCHIYDFVQPSVQSYWTEMCLNMTDSGVIDGCGADASWQIDPTGGTTAPDVEKEWDVGHRTMMRDTTLALGDGVLLGKDPWELDYHVNGVLHESCAASNTTIQTLQRLAQAAAASPRNGSAFEGGLVYECHNDDCEDANSVAAFLIGAGPYHYWGCGGWQGTNHYNPVLMNHTLGTPDGDGAYDSSSQIWSRSFGGGASKVTFNVSSNKGTIKWADEEVGI